MPQFEALFHELATTRLHLEEFRRRGGHFDERAELHRQLIGLRAEMARSRREVS